jgi:hypothetical protein
MSPEARASIAGICASIANGRRYSHIFDYSRGRYASVMAEVRDGRVNAYDYDRACHISGTLPSGVFDYGTSSHIELKQANGRISGYDYGEGRHFEATVSGQSISIYDYGTGSYHQYQAS